MGIVGGLISGVFGDKAADAQSDSAKQANQTLWDMYSTNRADEMPWMAAGSGAVNSLANLLGIDTSGAASQLQANATNGLRNQLSAMTPDKAMQYAKSAADPNISASREQTLDWVAKGIPFEVVNGVAVRSGSAPTAAGPAGAQAPGFGSLMKDFSTADFQTDPGYEFRLAEGQKALDRSAAAHGSLFSGATLKANDAYNQNFASNEFGNAYNRFQNNRQSKYNMLAGLSGLGQNSANTVTQAGHDTANNAGNNQMYAGNARASAYANWGNSINKALGDGQNNMLMAAMGGLI